MKTLKFKTNIKCDGCITTVTPHLDALPGLEQWTVDTNVPDKILTVTGSTEALTQEVIDTLKKAGYQAELI
ncbi:heavy-metal-associated domain-containing protein [Pedobacter hartonius]|uniref:Copper chaperone CopZ n=1 Tax=Pedobacter hartonius TaxID=425514 RepID=A0A1H4B560_9SPHI|nr:cation transporter [Pedobacter hartonius]SEA43247.1 Copper chaperone CopZ [Pedobacter hartonius]